LPIALWRSLFQSRFECQPLRAATRLNVQQRAGRHRRDAVERFLSVDDRLAVEMRDEIVALQADERRRSVRSTSLMRSAGGGSMPERPPLPRAALPATSRQPAAPHAPVREDLIHHAAHHVHGNREADAVGAEVLREHRRVDADQLALGVDEGSAGIAEIDGGSRSE
jgi:hypothetical protein